jgi:hypothetical protein
VNFDSIITESAGSGAAKAAPVPAAKQIKTSEKHNADRFKN